MSKQSIHIFEKTQKTLQDFNGDVYCPILSKRKVCLPFNQQKFHFLRQQKVQGMLSRAQFYIYRAKTDKKKLFGGIGTCCFARKTSRVYKNEKNLHF